MTITATVHNAVAAPVAGTFTVRFVLDPGGSNATLATRTVSGP